MGIMSIARRIKSNLDIKKIKSIGDGFIIGQSSTIIGGDSIIIGNDFHAGSRLKLQVWSKCNNTHVMEEYNSLLKIGDSVSFMENVMISCVSQITIGDGVLLGDNVFISDNSHGKTGEEIDLPPLERKLFVKGPILIEDNVWIGRNACIMGNVCIGKGAIIGANAVVTHDVLPNTVVAGVPAKEIV